MNVPFQDFKKEVSLRGDEYVQAAKRVIDSGWYILGPEVEAFEHEFADYLGSNNVIGVANGLEAIQIALLALDIGKGDEVITTPLSAIATTLAVLSVGATPKFVDIDDNGLIDVSLIESAITSRTKAVLPVHLYGNVINLEEILALCKKHNLYLIEDAAQAHGATFKARKAGTFGSFGCFSFYPTKNLGAIGDAGAIVTDDSELAKRARRIRDYGQKSKYVHIEYGLNSRLDEIQAAILRVKLKHLPVDTLKRQRNASFYDQLLKGSNVKPLSLNENTSSSRHLYIIKHYNRDHLTEVLLSEGVETLVHYPLSIPDQPIFKGSSIDNSSIPFCRRFVNEIISLPLNPFLAEKQIEKISQVIKDCAK